MGGMDNLLKEAGIGGESAPASQEGNTQAPVDEADQMANDMQSQIISQYDGRRISGTAPSVRRGGGGGRGRKRKRL